MSLFAQPEELPPEELAEIRVTANHADEGRIRTNDLVSAYLRDVPALLDHIAAREAAVKGLLQELSLIADDRAVTYGDLGGKEIAQRAAAYGITLE